MPEMQLSSSTVRSKYEPTSTSSPNWPARQVEIREPLLKRPFDMRLAGVGLLASSPLWLAVAAAIKINDGGPIFYSQDRVGIGGKPFKSWKFRSMKVNADRDNVPQQASEKDPRVT